MDLKLILTDVDGVLLNWEDQFHQWMQSRGYDKVGSQSYWLEHHYPGMTADEAERHVTEYNGSSWMLGLPPLRDARTGVAKLRDAGYRFHAITAMGNDPYAKELRQMNLDRVFGHGTFVDLTLVGLSESKRAALEPYRNSGLAWIEDKAKNARLGFEMGLTTYLVDHLYNRESDDEGLIRVNDWNDITNHVL